MVISEKRVPTKHEDTVRIPGKHEDAVRATGESLDQLLGIRVDEARIWGTLTNAT